MAKTGRIEVAEAIAAISGLVTVTPLGDDDFSVTPDDLFERTFNDPQVGIDDTRMRDFKKALKTLLKGEGIDATIDQLPENSNVVIEKVATIIRLALALAAAHKAVG